MDDKQILSMLLARDEGAINALIEQFGQTLHRIALNILNNTQNAQECVNDTYLALWNAIPPAEPEPLAPYVYRTGRNIALKRHRKDSAIKRNTAYDVSLDELTNYLPDEDLEHRIDSYAIGKAIDRFLSEQNRENRVIFLRRYYFGDSVKSIALEMGSSENVISVRLNRTRMKLKDYLIKEGFYYETRTN